MQTVHTQGEIEIGGLKLEYGSELPSCTVGWETLGEANLPVIVTMGGISAGRHVASGPKHLGKGWWEGFVGTGCAVDPAHYRVLAFDFVGGVGISTGPGDISYHETTGSRTFPAVTPSDQAEALARLLDGLGIDRIHAIVGSSYGAMTAVAFAVRHPARVDRLVAISGTHRTHPMATALRSIQRRIVRQGLAIGEASEALILARALAMTTYRSVDEFESRFGSAPGWGDEAGWASFPVEDYLLARGRSFTDEFSAQAFLTLSESLDLHRVDPAAIRAATTIVTVEDDPIAPPWQAEEFSDALTSDVCLFTLKSKFGHDAFLKEPELLRPILVEALSSNPGVPRDNGYSDGDTTDKEDTTDVEGARDDRDTKGGGARACVVSPCATSARTRAVRAGIDSDSAYGAVMPPIHLTSTFTFEGFDRPRKHDYSRTSNPTRDHLGSVIASLEGGVGGVVTSTGMSAVALVLQLVKPGELVVAPHDCYGGTYRLLNALAQKGCFEVVFVDQRDERALQGALNRRPAMVWIETPSNPLLRVTDIAEVAGRARSVGATVVADNTFLSPALQRPIELGADIVVHSTTKYLNGHSDVVGGAVVARTDDLLERLQWWGNCLGLAGSSFDAYLTLRGIRTLHARIAVHEANALRVVETLVQHPLIERVHHPSLADHPGHAVAIKQQDGFGAMISFELKGGVEAVKAFVDGLEHICLAESLGGVESLVAHPATMTHASMDEDARRRAGIRDGLLRLSVGIESADDLVLDIERALERVGRIVARR